MYPKAVLQALLRSHPDWLNPAPEPPGDDFRREFASAVATGFAVEDWILRQAPSDAPIREYLDFLRSAKSKFTEVGASMGYWNPNASHSLQHDKWSVGWAGDALLPVANYLYVLHSFGVAGDCLECGAFKGSSTACLSYVCKQLGLTLYCADSFAGLPSPEAHYGTGDFAGTRAEVENNVRRCGAIEAVHFIEGWYESSLRDFAPQLSVIWMDVDLQQSVLDAMGNVFSKLDRHGVIFSDGFCVGVDFTPENTIVFTGGEPAGFHRFFESRGMNIRAFPAGPKGLALILPRPEETPWLRVHPERFQYLLERL
jgi:hypothetical protein